MDIWVMSYDDIETFDTEKCCIMNLIEKLGEQAETDYFRNNTITLVNMHDFYEYLLNEYTEEEEEKENGKPTAIV